MTAAYETEDRDFIVTYSKKRVNPLQPKKEDIVIEDIAHALSLLSRANGHSKTFYSVAQHCINCVYEAIARGYNKRIQLACLLHDGSEAYIGDVTRPFKQHLTYYLEIEAVLEKLIWEVFGLKNITMEERKQIFSIDDDILYYEFIHLMDENIREVPPTLYGDINISERPFAEVEEEFLTIFNNLII